MYNGSVWQNCLPGWVTLWLQDHDPIVKTAIFLEFLAPKFNTEQEFSNSLFWSNTVMCSWRFILKYYKNFPISFFHRKSIMHQQDTINIEVKIIRNKYILKIRKGIWSFHHVTVEETGLLGCCNMFLDNCCLTFERDKHIHLSGFMFFDRGSLILV